MGMRDQARPRADEGGSQIDLTPMLDVVFIMLIFFIVTSSFVKEPGVEIAEASGLYNGSLRARNHYFCG